MSATEGAERDSIQLKKFAVLEIDFTAVNVKAKTNEQLGDVGTGEAMTATAIVLLKKKKKRTL